MLRLVWTLSPRGARNREGYGGPTAAGDGVLAVRLGAAQQVRHPGGARPQPSCWDGDTA